MDIFIKQILLELLKLQTRVTEKKPYVWEGYQIN